MTGFFASHAAALVGNGYQVVPIPKGTKGPVLPDWRSLNIATEAELQAFRTGKHTIIRDGEEKLLPNTRPTDGVGILAKWTPAIDIDAYDTEVVAQMMGFIGDHMELGPVRIGQAPKALILCRTTEPFAKVTSARWKSPGGKVSRLEILGDGQQFVAYHIHPDTLRPYDWPGDWENPIDIAASALPEITEAHAKAFCTEFDRIAKATGWELVGDGGSGGADVSDALAMAAPPPESDGEVARVKQALEHISADCSREEYLTVLAGLKWTGWLCAEEIALEWAQKSEEDKFSEHDFNRDWKSLTQERLGKRTVTLGSLVKMAKAAGFDASRPVEPDAAESAAEFETLLNEVQALDPKDRVAFKAMIKKIAEAKLDAIDLNDVLTAFAKATKNSVRDVKAALVAARKIAREHDEPTHANYSKKLLASIEEKTGNDARGVEGKMWMFDGNEGIWVGKDPDTLSVDVARAFDGLEGCSRVNDYVAIAKHSYRVTSAQSEDFFSDAPIGMACEGRFYTIEGGEIKREELAAHHRQRVLVPVIPKKTETPLWDSLMARAFDGDPEREQELLLEEFAGGMLLGFGHKFEKALLLKGVGRAGKGTILKILAALVPQEFQCAVSPEKWAEQYYLATLSGRRLNIVGELSEDNPIDSAVFKSVLGRDKLEARRPAQMPFTFVNSASHVFNSNHFVPTRDHTEAFYGRWILMEFRNSMVDSGEQINVNLAEEIIAKELPGVAAKFIAGAKRLLARGAYLTTTAHDRLMGQWQRRSSSLVEFVNDGDVVVIGDRPDQAPSRRVFYDAYAIWCRESNRRPLGKQKLYDEMDSSKELARIGVRMVCKSTGNFVIRGLILRSQMFDVEWQKEDDDEL